MELLVAVVVVTFTTGLRRGGGSPRMRTLPFAIVCTVVGAAYFGQRVI